jgi:hypothetical protein
VAEIGLQRPRIVPLIGQGVSAGVPEHVRVRLEAKLGLDPARAPPAWPARPVQKPCPILPFTGN